PGHGEKRARACRAAVSAPGRTPAAGPRLKPRADLPGAVGVPADAAPGARGKRRAGRARARGFRAADRSRRTGGYALAVCPPPLAVRSLADRGGGGRGTGIPPGL